jgi:hypothetical protein
LQTTDPEPVVHHFEQPDDELTGVVVDAGRPGELLL